MKVRGIALAAGIFLAIALSPSANAGSLRQGSTGSSGAVTGSLPGQVLWGSYQTEIEFFGTFDRDEILRLVNPNGAANSNLAGARPQTVCAMIYVFDSDQEMGECCGCPLTSTQLATFSVEHNLTSNFGIQGLGVGNAIGAIAIVAAAPNAPTCLQQSGACNGGCDPTNVPGYSVTNTNNLLGSITHNQIVSGIPFTNAVFGVTEVPLSDDAGGDPNNLLYLQAQCGALVGNGTQGGICNCPLE